MMNLKIYDQGMTVIAPDHSSAFWLHQRLARTGTQYESVRLPEDAGIEFRAAGTRDWDCLKEVALNGYGRKSYAPVY